MTDEKKALVIPDTVSLGKVFAESGMFPDIKTQAQAIVKIMAGSELGFPPVYSMTKVFIVKGRIMVAAEALGAMVKRSGRYDYIVKTDTDLECVLTFIDNGKAVYESRFTMEDAKRADLVRDDSGWKKYPRAMLRSKALSQGARIVCPHIISGVYLPEDFPDEVKVDAEGHIEVKATELQVATNATTISATTEVSTKPLEAHQEVLLEHSWLRECPEHKVRWGKNAQSILCHTAGKAEDGKVLWCVLPSLLTHKLSRLDQVKAIADIHDTWKKTYSELSLNEKCMAVEMVEGKQKKEG